MNLVSDVQAIVLLILGLGALCLTGFAAVDVLRHRADLFPAVGSRLSKGAWTGILVAAFLIALLGFTGALSGVLANGSGGFGPLGLLNVIGVVAAGVYLADIRPKIRQISGGGRSSGSYGPYGPY